MVAMKTAPLSLRPALCYVAFAVALSWSYWGLLLALGLRVDAAGAGAHPGVTHLPGLLGPAVAAILTARWYGGPGAGWALLRRAFTRWPRPAFRGWLLALSPLIAGALLWLVWYALGREMPPAAAFWHFPGLPAQWGPVAVVLAVVCVNGLGEELGWRGYLGEVLSQRFSRWSATCWVAAVWMAWHAPLFWLNASMAAMVGPMLLGWALGLACGAFVLAQVHEWSGRCVAVVALWHAAYNLVVATEAGHGAMATVLSAGVMVWGCTTAAVWWRQRRRDGVNQSDSRVA